MPIKINKILCPTDFSELSAHAVKYAREFASAFGAQIHCLHIVDEALQYWNAMGPEGAPIVPAVEDLTRYSETHMRQFVDEHLMGLKFAPVAKIVSGAPHHEIVQYAFENNIDLIIIATHGRSGLVHALLGSTAEKVVRAARCPVLTVREHEREFVSA
ncbi:MAG: universal stress protein [Phycisphaerales bacterium]|nr:universal stress protein [Phycisphaerales bacterium]